MKKPIPLFKKPQPVDGIPKLAEVMEDLSALEQQRLNLGREQAALGDELRAIAEAERDQTAKVGTADDLESPASRLARLKAGILKPDTTAKPVDRKSEIYKRRAEIETLLNEIQVAIEDERRRGSAIIVQRIAGLRRERVRAVCEALRMAHAANLELQSIVDALDTDGVVHHEFQYTRPSFLGWPTDPNGPLGRYFAEMRAAGHIDAQDIPAELQ